MAKSSAYREAWAPRSKSLVMSSTNRMKRTGPSIEPWGTHSDAERAAVGTTNLDFSSTIRKKERTQRTKQGGSLSERSL